MINWQIGCSGFHYKHWKEIFYPKGLAQTKWFDFYCRHFTTLELNVTFYRFPERTFLEGFYARSPDHFTFSVKAPRLITHYKKFVETKKLLSEFYANVSDGLKEKLGCVLFQMPPGTTYTPERLERMIESLNPDYENALEFRHVSWWNEEVYFQLAKHKIGFCSMSHPALPDNLPGNTTLLYHRFHGVPELYKSRYNLDELKHFSNQVKNDPVIKKAYIYFNNDIGGSAIVNALELHEIVQ